MLLIGKAPVTKVPMIGGQDIGIGKAQVKAELGQLIKAYRAPGKVNLRRWDDIHLLGNGI